MRLCLYKRSSQAKILKTDEEDQVFNAAENKANSITYILFQIEVLLRFGATAIDGTLERDFAKASNAYVWG